MIINYQALKIYKMKSLKRAMETHCETNYKLEIVFVVVVCRDPAYSGSTAYADLGNIYSLY